MTEGPKLSASDFQELENQAESLTQELGGSLRAWRTYGSKNWPIVLVLYVEADQAAFTSLNNKPQVHGILTVKVLLNGEAKGCVFRHKPKYFRNGQLKELVRRNFVEVERRDGKFCPKR